MKLRTLLKNIALITLISCSYAFAGEATFAPEFEFTNAKLENANYGSEGQLHVSNQNLAAQEKWAKLMKQICKQRKDCHVEEVFESEYAYSYDGEIYQDYFHPDYHVVYNDGFYYEVTLDPTVIEVKLKPSTLADFKKNAERIQRDVFDFARTELGLNPPKEAGGHIHLGYKSSFNEDIRAFRNFMVDIMNHQELWTMMKNTDFRNAPPLSALPESSYEAFTKIISDIDSGKLKDIEEFAKRMKSEVYHITFDKTVVSSFDKASKYQAVNINRLGKSFSLKQKTIELRAVPVQQDFSEFLLWSELFQGRIDYLKKAKKPIKLRKFNIMDASDWTVQFNRYVKQSGLDPKDFKSFIAKSVPRDGCAKMMKKNKSS